jgi:hypothetical protein
VGGSQWIALTEQGALGRLDLEQGTFHEVARLPEGVVDLTEPVELHRAPRGRFAAVVNTLGSQGVVVDLSGQRPPWVLDREDDSYEVSRFPLAFFLHHDRVLLLHATAWNRLDVTDPTTGQLLTPRGPTSYSAGEEQPAHYLDYFHCGLTVSPSGKRVVDSGWVWQPAGVLIAWSLERWLEQNVWESEDGPSRVELGWCENLWDVPLCWLDDMTVAIWGYGQDDRQVLPAVRLCDATTGLERTWFPGPETIGPRTSGVLPDSRGWMEFDGHLFAFSEQHGASVWDVATGERLLQEAGFFPSRYHRRARQFITLLPDGTVRLSTVHGDA